MSDETKRRRKIVSSDKELMANINNLQAEAEGFGIKVDYDKLKCMRNGVHSRMEVNFDGLLINMRLLSQREISQINAEVRVEINGIREELRYPGFDSGIYARKILSKATTRSPEELKPDLAEQTIDSFTPDQQQALMQVWSDFNKECCPVIDDMTDEEVGELYQELKKNPLQANNLLPWQLRKVLFLSLMMLTKLTGN